LTPHTLTLGTDNGSAFTARAFKLVLSGLGIAHRRGGYRDPESQAFIESWFAKLKERCVWLHEFETLDQAREVTAAYVDSYHHRAPHSGLAYRSPAEVAPKTKYHRLFAKNLLKRWPALWTFTLLDGPEPTNNHAERGLRGAVIQRKLSLGSQSEQGERTIERLLSASITCRLQRRSLFAYLSDVLTAKTRGDPIPAWPEPAGPERLPVSLPDWARIAPWAANGQHRLGSQECRLAPNRAVHRR